MSGYGLLPRTIFKDPAVRVLSDRAWRLFTYAACGPHANIIGAGYLPDGYIAADLGWPIETVSHTVSELTGSGLVLRFLDPQYFAIPRYFEWNKIHNRNVMIAALKEIEPLPPDLALVSTINGLQPFAIQFGPVCVSRLEAVRKRLGDGSQQPSPSPSPSPSLQPSQQPSLSPALARVEALRTRLGDKASSLP